MTPRHLTPFALASALALAAPVAPAAAATTSHRHLAAPHTVTGVVLEAHRHTLRVAAANGAVRSFTVGRLSAGVRRGARVRFTAAGHAARKLAVLSHVRQLSFLARVVRSHSGQLVVATGDGARVQLSARRAKVKRAAPATQRRTARARHRIARAHIASDVLPVSVAGLQPGETIRITINLSPAGNELALTITLLPAPVPSTPGATSTGSASDLAGTVVAVDEENSAFTVVDAQGNQTDVTLSDALIALDDTLPSVCDTVALATRPDPAADGALIADAVRTTGTDTSGLCDSSGDDGGSGDQEVLGAVTALDPVAGTVTVTPAGGPPVTLTADPSLLDGVALGDQVDAFYADAGDGTLALDALMPADTTGVSDSAETTGPTVTDPTATADPTSAPADPTAPAGPTAA